MAIKKVQLGNRLEMDYDPIASLLINTLYQDGEQRYDAVLTVNGYDASNNVFYDDSYDLVAGTIYDIDMALYIDVVLTCNAHSGYIFTSASHGDNDPITVNSASIIYPFTTSDINQADNQGGQIVAKLRQFVIKTEKVDVDTFTVGNTRIDGRVSQVGPPQYEATIRVITGEFDFIDYPVVLGVDTPVNMDGYIESVKLICSVLEGYKFTNGKNGELEIPFERYSIDYSVPSTSLPPNNNDSRQFYIQSELDTPEPPPDETINNNYLLTKSELSTFQASVYSSNMPDDYRGKVQDFVSNVFVLPFVVPESEILQREAIRVRDLELTVASRLKSDVIHLDLGTINIVGDYGNSLDFVGVEISLFLPFKSGEIKLDPRIFMNKEVSIEYWTNPSNGVTTYNLYGGDGLLLETNTFKMGAEYPFYSIYDIQEKLFEPENVINSIRTAYVVVKIPDYSNSPTPKATVKGNVSGEVGKVIFNEVEIQNIVYANEYDELLSILRSGILIK